MADDAFAYFDIIISTSIIRTKNFVLLLLCAFSHVFVLILVLWAFALPSGLYLCFCLCRSQKQVLAVWKANYSRTSVRWRPPLVSDHLSSATSFPKYQKFPSHATTSRKRPLLELKVWNFPLFLTSRGGAVASWLVHSSPERAVRVRALARGHCVVLVGKTLNSHGASLHPGV